MANVCVFFSLAPTAEESASELHEFAGVCLTQMRDAVVDLVKIVHDTKIKLPQGAANDPMDADETMEDIHKHYREYSRVVRGLVKNLRDEVRSLGSFLAGHCQHTSVRHYIN